MCSYLLQQQSDGVEDRHLDAWGKPIAQYPDERPSDVNDGQFEGIGGGYLNDFGEGDGGGFLQFRLTVKNGFSVDGQNRLDACKKEQQPLNYY